ncbi:MAG TPA: insulinase family protein [Crocinitomix sp.]|nr:insulinase family protein [Crocinitomix sp.]
MNRTIAPKYTKAQSLDIEFPHKIELSNGISLYHLSEVQDDTVKLDIVWDAGSKYQEKPLVASFTNKLLLAGTTDLNAQQISEKFDFLGGYIAHDIDKDQAGVTLYGLNDKISDIFNVFNEAFADAVFPETEIEKLVEIKKNNYKVSQEKVSTLCHKEFNKHIFGTQTAYGRVAELKDFDNLNINDLKNYYQYYLNTKPVLFLVGKVSNQFIEQLNNWTKTIGQKKISLPNQAFIQKQGKVVIHKKDAIQSAIRIGKLLFTKTHPDYYKFQVLNTILGGYFGSRLMANIREDKGYTYGIGSGLSVLEDAGYFFVSTEVAKDVTDLTIKEIYNEIEKLQTQLVSDQELEKVKNYLLGEFLRQSDGPIAIMENYKNIYFNNLSENYYSDFIKAVHSVTPKQLQDIAIKHLNKNTMLEVVAGNV